MISAYCSAKETQKLTKWLVRQPWAGPDNAQDLAHEAYLAALDRQHKGLKPRPLMRLAQDAARGPGYRLLATNTRLRDAHTGTTEAAKTQTRRDVELQVDLSLVLLTAPPDNRLKTDLEAALDLIGRVGCDQLRQAVQLVLGGTDMSEAAQQVGLTAVQLSRALALVGRKLTGHIRRKGKKRDPQQLDLFGGV